MRELNYRLRLDYDRGILMPTSQFKTQNIDVAKSVLDTMYKFLPILIVVNVNSTSTPLRQCVIPNRPCTLGKWS